MLNLALRNSTFLKFLFFIVLGYRERGIPYGVPFFCYISTMKRLMVLVLTFGATMSAGVTLANSDLTSTTYDTTENEMFVLADDYGSDVFVFALDVFTAATPYALRFERLDMARLYNLPSYGYVQRQMHFARARSTI